MSLPPNTTLYVHNLNDEVKKEELRAQLYALFTPYGKVLDVVAQKGAKKRGQAFIVFRDLAGATSAMRNLDGELFYDKKMQIEYAKSASHATLRQQDPTFISPKLNLALNAVKKTNGASKVTVSHAENEQRKRVREEDSEMANGDAPDGKKRRGDDPDDMDMEEDEDEPPKATNGHPPSNPPSSLLLCQNLPTEVTNEVLSVLFQQYPGFQSTNVASVIDPGTKTKTAHVRYDTSDAASVALEALDNFQIKRGCSIRVSYAPL